MRGRSTTSDGLVFPAEALSQHTAVLGKTGSGKTSTAKLIVEHVVAEGNRVCVLDPIKSDWWGVISSADGQSPGLPFSVLGGPHGHVPLHSGAGAAIAELVGMGALPLSIIDMADFEPGGQAKFFVEFAPILMRKMRGVLYLVLEEAHLFAPKERSGLGQENMAIHWAKMLAMAGRSKGIRLLLLTQRTQSLHNAMLGSCETMIVHRLTAPADQAPVKKWLLANTRKDVAKEVADSLASLKTGTAWVCSGEATFFEHVRFPRISTFDNTRTPKRDSGHVEVKAHDVDHAALRDLIGTAVEEAEAQDPEKLHAEIARLRAELAARPEAEPMPMMGEVEAALTARVDELSRAVRAGVSAYNNQRETLVGARDTLAEVANTLAGVVGSLELTIGPEAQLPAVLNGAPIALKTRKSRETVVEAPEISADSTPSEPDSRGGLTTPERRILDSLGWWAAVARAARVSNKQCAAVAGYSAKGGAYRNPRSALNVRGLIRYVENDVALTEKGATLAKFPRVDDPFEAVLHLKIIKGPERKILEALREHPHGLTNDQLADQCEYAVGGGAYRNPRSKLNALALISNAGGRFRLAEFLRS